MKARWLLIVSLGVMAFAAATAYAAPQQTVVTGNVQAGETGFSEPMAEKFPPIEKIDNKKTITAPLRGPLFIDNTSGSKDGWRIDIGATPFAEKEPERGFVSGTKAYSLPQGSLLLNSPSEISNSNAMSAPPNAATGAPWPIDKKNTVTVLKAEKNEGIGKTSVNFPENALALTVEPQTAKEDKINYPNEATKYKSILTWTLVFGP